MSTQREKSKYQKALAEEGILDIKASYQIMYTEIILLLN